MNTSIFLSIIKEITRGEELIQMTMTANVPVKVRDKPTLSQTHRALDRRSTAPAENRPATATTMKHSSALVTYLLILLPSRSPVTGLMLSETS